MMFNFNNHKTRKIVSAVIIFVIILAMVGGTVLAGFSMFLR